MNNSMNKTPSTPDTSLSARRDWGGLLALDSRLLNYVLREQYLKTLNDFGAMIPFDLEAALEEGGRTHVSLRKVVFGPPQVRFESTGVPGSKLKVRMNIVAGDYMQVQQRPGSPKRIIERSTLIEGVGYYVEANLTVRLARSDSGRYTSLVLDLESATDFTTNLGPTCYAKKMLGKHLQESIQYMHAYQRTYQLGHFVMDDYHPLSPDQFVVQTQVAPWGQNESSSRSGEGAVLVYMKLGIDLYSGSLPDPNSDLAYPILEQATGLPSTLVLAADFNSLGAGKPEDVLRTFKVPADLEFVVLEKATGVVDLVAHGTWRATGHAVKVEPAFAQVVSGNSITFTAEGAAGALQWSAVNLNRPAATGSFSGTQYTACQSDRFVEDQQMVLVTATASGAGNDGAAHALVMESARAVQIAPRVATWAGGEKSIELRASNTSTGNLGWELREAVLLGDGEQRLQRLEGSLGDLEDKGDGCAIFTPDPDQDDGDLFKVQLIRCTNLSTGQYAESAVMIIHWPANLQVSPFYVTQGLSIQPTRFDTVPAGGRPVTWTVRGEGSFKEGNLYTPPENPQLPVAVVIADDGDERNGYAIVEFNEGLQSTAGLLSWESLDTFELRALSAPRCFANGWQQIEIEVKVAAADDHMGRPVEISDADLATLKFLNVDSNNELPFLAPLEEALYEKEANNADWAVNRDANMIDRQEVMNGGSVITPLRARTRRFYLHSRKPGMIKVIASIQNTLTGKTVLSSERDNGELEVHALNRPSYTRQLYSFDRTRAPGGDTSPSDGDDFAYVDRSTDNWLLEHVSRDGKVIKFARVLISASNRKSLLSWSWTPGSSTTPIADDDLVSYTSFTFKSVDERIDNPLVFDGLLYRMALHRQYELPEEVRGNKPGAGEFMISLYRDVEFRMGHRSEDPYIAALEGDLIFSLLDEEGHEHKLRVCFEATAAEQSKGITRRDLLQLYLR